MGLTQTLRSIVSPSLRASLRLHQMSQVRPKLQLRAIKSESWWRRLTVPCRTKCSKRSTATAGTAYITHFADFSGYPTARSSRPMTTEGLAFACRGGWMVSDRPCRIWFHAAGFARPLFDIRAPDGMKGIFADCEQFMAVAGERPDGLADLFAWAQQRHGDGALDDDFSIVRLRL